VRNRQVNLLFKTAGNINHAYSPLKISCRDVFHVISCFLWGQRYSYHIPSLCAKRLGGWTLVNNIRNVDTLSKFKSELKKIDETENHSVPKLITNQ
jgi:hypothetical protein